MLVADIYARHAVFWIDSTSQDLFEEGVKFASEVDFTKSHARNTTIRFGLLGYYVTSEGQAITPQHSAFLRLPFATSVVYLVLMN